jgi:phosphoglycerol transferase MdoB-like AlkP superfamily enzyme
VLAWATLPLCPLFCLFVMDYMNFLHLTSLLDFVQEHPGSLIFECLVMLFLFLVGLLLTGRPALTAGVLGGVSLVFAYINYTKVALNGDNFYPKDITMASSMGGLTSFISGSVPKWYLLGALALILWVVLLAVLRLRLPLAWFVRIPAALVLAAAVWFPFSTMERSSQMLERFGMAFMDAALQSSNYRANGFVGAFTINLLMGNVQAPEDYSRDAVQALLADYEAQPGDPDAPDYDVIVVLSESFFEVRCLEGVTFSENPLANYDAILQRENTYSGKQHSTASGGGTVRPEFDILTGLTTDYLGDVASPYELVKGTVESYVSHYRDGGYDTVALHPYDKTFYSRSSAYPYLGFNRFLGQAELGELVELTYSPRGQVTDASTLAAMEAILDAADQPTFLFAITMENHQPYTALAAEDITIQVDGPMLDQDTLDAVTTYTQGLADADRMLGALVDYIDGRDRPTVLLFFGDHIPTLGSNRAAYYETGLLGGDRTEAEQLDFLYSAPFLIYSNTGAVSGMLSQREDNAISSYYLLEVVAEMTGFPQTAYMSLLEDFYQRVPCYNIRLGLTETEDISALARMHELITYDRLLGAGYSMTP